MQSFIKELAAKRIRAIPRVPASICDSSMLSICVVHRLEEGIRVWHPVPTCTQMGV